MTWRKVIFGDTDGLEIPKATFSPVLAFGGPLVEADTAVFTVLG